ncbi:tail fiber repeat 2-containing protein [Yersinia pseudotuberculosis]|uniref:tail fiber protein n=3 Tax=Yersinia pseudotuberculosis TaxID=633 RepID=UPI0005E76704|nr:phage tail protein [Yersinia pseudotuberculosis]CNC98934.1 tail fiber repeat 2-containing protein [Yersinia pseudotuberculosis]CNI61302.1 tail fiber repeat 2-containing protein [Yersinia pseudotuberculosis]VEE73078.1 tail fiber repeat 2-containing protein [Yersinia pseudotuberculosis]
MYGLDNTSGISVMPPVAPAVSPTPLWFTEGGAGQSPSYPGQDWFNMFQAEHLNVLADAGISPDKSKLNQLATAIKKLIATGLPEIPVASLSQKGIVQLSSSINSDSETLAATSKAVKTASEAALKIEKNLSDLNDTAAARTNLGLGGASSLNVGTTAGTVAAGNDSRIVGALQKTGGTISGNILVNGVISTPNLITALGVSLADGTTIVQGDGNIIGAGSAFGPQGLVAALQGKIDGVRVTATVTGPAGESPIGAFMVGLNGAISQSYRYIQILRNGVWSTITT